MAIEDTIQGAVDSTLTLNRMESIFLQHYYFYSIDDGLT
jgi:hypothetical protein